MALSGASETLQKAIKDVVADSPLVAEAGSLSKASSKLCGSVDKGASYEDANKQLRKIESGYALFEANLKKAHDIHHEKPVADAAKQAKAAFKQLQDHMSGKRPADETGGANPRVPQEENR